MATDLTIEQQLRRWALNWEIDDNDWTIQALKQLCEAVAAAGMTSVYNDWLPDDSEVNGCIHAALDRIQQEGNSE